MADASGFRHWALLSPSQDLTTSASSKKKKPSPRQWPPQRPAVSEAPFAKPLAPRPRPPPAPRTRSTNPDATQKNVTAFLAAFQALNIQKRLLRCAVLSVVKDPPAVAEPADIPSAPAAPRRTLIQRTLDRHRYALAHAPATGHRL